MIDVGQDAVADGTIRPGIDPNGVLMALGGITLIAGEPDQRDLAHRLLDDLRLDGLQHRR